jgi:hypothetical protein
MLNYKHKWQSYCQRERAKWAYCTPMFLQTLASYEDEMRKEVINMADNNTSVRIALDVSNANGKVVELIYAEHQLSTAGAVALQTPLVAALPTIAARFDEFAKTHTE